MVRIVDLEALKNRIDVQSFAKLAGSLFSLRISFSTTKPTGRNFFGA